MPRIFSLLLGFIPGVSYLGVHNKVNMQGIEVLLEGVLHALDDQLLGLCRSCLGPLQDDLVMDLQRFTALWITSHKQR